MRVTMHVWIQATTFIDMRSAHWIQRFREAAFQPGLENLQQSTTSPVAADERFRRGLPI